MPPGDAWLNRRMDREHRRLAVALLLSLLVHALLLTLVFEGQGLGLPGFGFPWRERRIEAPELRVVLAPAPGTAGTQAPAPAAAPAQQALIDRPVPREPAPPSSVPAAPAPEGKPAAMPPAARMTGEARPAHDVVARVAAAKAPVRADKPDHASPAPVREPDIRDATPSAGAATVVPADPPVPTPVIAAAPDASNAESVTSAFPDASDRPPDATRQAEAQLEAQRQEVARQQEAARIEAARLQAEHQEAERRAVAQLDAQRQEAARQQEAARADAAREEAERQDAARQAAARQEAQRQEEVRQAAARQEARRQEEVRQQESARREAALQPPPALSRLCRSELQNAAPMSTAPIKPVKVSGMCMCTPTNMIAASAPIAQKAPCSR